MSDLQHEWQYEPREDTGYHYWCKNCLLASPMPVRDAFCANKVSDLERERDCLAVEVERLRTVALQYAKHLCDEYHSHAEGACCGYRDPIARGAYGEKMK